MPSTSYTPLSLTGFNKDVVFEKGSSTYADNFDQGFRDWFETGTTDLVGTVLNYGLPSNDEPFSSTAGTPFQFQPYNGTNVLELYNQVLGGAFPLTTGTLTLTTPKSFSDLAVLATSADVTNPSSTSGSLVVNFTDGTSSSPFSFNANDENTASGALPGLVDRCDRWAYNEVGRPDGYGQMFETDINLATAGLDTKLIQSITFTIGSGADETGIFAVSGGIPNFTVQGSHTYSEEGSYPIAVTIDQGTQPFAQATNTANVSDAGLTAGALTPPAANEGVPFTNQTVFHFTDADPNGAASDYTAVVTLGDGNTVTLTGTPSANGQIVTNPNGGFDVQLSYTYAEAFTNQTFGARVTDAGGAAPISAVTHSFSVTSATDFLVNAIVSANAAGGPTTITLLPGATFDYMSANNSTNGSNALPVITGNITIIGNGDTIKRDPSASSAFRLFDVASGGSLTLENLTLQGGLAKGTGPAAEGGAIYNSGSLKVRRVTVKSNQAEGGSGRNGGGTTTHTAGNGGNGSAGSGGGLYVAGGTVSLTGDTLTSNKAEGGKGGNATFFFGGNGGAGGAGSGGGLYVQAGTVSLSNDLLSNNQAVGGYGGYGGSSTAFNGNARYNLFSGGAGGAGSGGGLYVAGGTVSLTGDTLTSNKADGGNGGYDRGGKGGNGGAASGGGLYVLQGVTVRGKSTAIAQNTVTGGAGGAGGTDVNPQLNGSNGSAGTASFADIAANSPGFGTYTQTTTTTLSSSVNPSLSGQNVTFTAVVSAGTGTPSGSVTFSDTGGVLGSGTLSVVNGVDEATFTTSTLAVGSTTITATYSGDSTFEGSNDSLTQQVNAVTASNLQAMLNTTTQATFQENNNSDAQTLLNAIDSLSPQGTPVTITIDLASGNYSDLNPALPALGFTLIINGVSKSTTITGQSPALTVVSGTVVVNNVTLITSTDAPTVLVEGGSLILNNDDIESSTGYSQAALAVTGGSLTLGSTNILDVNGAGQFLQAGSFSGITEQGDNLEHNGALIAHFLSLTSVSSSSSTSVYGQNVTLTATVTTANDGTPGGRVDFLDATTNQDLGSYSVVAVGGSYQVVLNTSALSAGTHNILATYSGDSTYGFSSGSLNQTVAYGTQLLFNNNKPVHSGAALPIKLALTDASGADISSPNIVVTATGLVDANGNAVPLSSAGNANPNNLFRYDASLGGYIFNLDTKGLKAGTYTFYYKAGNDPTLHSLTFIVA